LFFVFYYLIPYRKKVVMDNLRKSFPEKSQKEINVISRKFYSHFTDLILESLKNFSITHRQVLKRYGSVNTAMLDRLHEEGKSIILCGGHFANWEFWAMAAAADFKHPLYALYTTLTNPYFDRKMQASRSKFGLHMISTRKYSHFLKENINKVQFTSVFGFDQSPSNPDKAVWVNFLGIDTAAQFGAEKYAKDYDMPVIFCHQYKTARGYYEAHYDLITENARSFEHGALTQRLYDILEKDIRENPHLWLWTHRRWKHSR
jgi:KDO2-lipid IV(A) lauroyltransferase